MTRKIKVKRKPFKVKPISEVAKSRVGRVYLPTRSGSKEKSKAISCTPNVSGVSAWYLLECGIRVCVLYKNWEPFLWVGSPKINPKGGETFGVISENKEANPYLNNHSL